MPFSEKSFLMLLSGKNQNKYSLSEESKIESGLLAPIERLTEKKERASLCTFKRAALTVEAAIVLPIFVMTIICIASIMGIYSVTLEKIIELRESAELTAAAAGVSEEEIWIELPGAAEFSPFFLPSGIGTVTVWCTGSARAWTGRDEDSIVNNNESSSEYVYITENASVYHTSSSCTHLKLSISQISSSQLGSARNENGGKYHACEKCSEGTAIADTVYITEDGDRYHNKLSCSGLKRTVTMVDIDQVSHLSECSRCQSAKQ